MHFVAPVFFMRRSVDASGDGRATPAGHALFTLRAADEVRVPQFGDNTGDVVAEMVAIARTIVERRTGRFDPSTRRDRCRRVTHSGGRVGGECDAMCAPLFECHAAQGLR